MLPLGIHLSYWQTSWTDALAPLIDKAHLAGYDVAEFPLLYPDLLPYSELRARLDSYGMKASCGTGLGPTTDITSPDPSIRKAGLQHLQTCLEGAARLGSPVLGGLTYAGWGSFPTDQWGIRRKNCLANLRLAASIASDVGVRLCLEIVNRFEGYLLNTVEQGLQLLDEADHPNLYLHLDTFHLNIEEDHIGRAICQAGNRLGHFHCVENNRKAPGKGHIAWSDVKQSLNQIQYQGYLVVETFANPAGEVGRGLNIWRPLADDLDTAASEAVTFLKSEFNNARS